MKTLTDYQTPETDAHFNENVWSKYDYGSRRHLGQEDINFAKSLERRLAACREALEEYALNFGDNERQARAEFGNGAIDRELRRRAALQLTAPLASPKPAKTEG